MSIQQPKGHWFWGNTKQFASNTLGFVQDCMANYSGVCYAKIGFKNFYLPLNAVLADHVLRQNNKNYKKSFAYAGLKVFLGNGLLTNEGQEWLAQRRLIQPAFYKESISKLTDLMLKETQEMIAQWKVEKEFSLTHHINTLTRNIITKAIFGKDLEGNKALEALPHILASFRQYGNDKMKNPLKLPLWMPTASNRQFKTHFRTFKALLSEAIAQRKQSPEKYQDILALFIQLEDEEGNRMNEQQVFDEIATLFIAGQETTSNALQFAFYLLATHHEVKTKVKQSIVKGGEEATKLVDACSKESLRLYPPAWAISREAINDDVLGDAKVKKGDTVFVPIYAFHRDPSQWEQADTFIPERFLEEYPKKYYLPFGTGPRFCIGNHFAMQEMNIVIAEVLKQLDIRLISPTKLSFTTLMTLAPKEEIRLALV